MVYKLIIKSPLHIKSDKDIVIIILEKHIQQNSHCNKSDPRKKQKRGKDNITSSILPARDKRS